MLSPCIARATLRSSAANADLITCRRMVRDGVASSEECGTVLESAEFAMRNLFHQGGSTSLAPDGSDACEADA